MAITCEVSRDGDVLRLAGTPREQGLEHGRRARDAISANIRLAYQGLDAPAGRRWDPWKILEASERFAAREAPEILDEIKGIADGSGVEYGDVLMLNLPVFLVFGFLPLDCSQIMLAPPATVDGHTYLAKTRDLAHERLQHVVLHRTYAGGRDLIEVGVAGSITWPGSGLNSDGLALSTSGCWSRRMPFRAEAVDQGWLLVNLHLLLRDSRSVDDVIARVQRQPRLTSINIVAADRHTAADIEVTADRVVWRQARDGVLIHTNHYCSAELRALGPTSAENPSSHHRYAVLEDYTRRHTGRMTAADIDHMLASHEGYPQLSVCRHQVDGEGSETAYASIADVTTGHMRVLLDNPCRVLVASPS